MPLASDELMRQYIDRILELVKEKNRGYGDSFSASAKEFLPEFGRSGSVLVSYCLRTSDKLHRLASLSKKQDLNHPAIEDALRDIIGYSLVILSELGYVHGDEKEQTTHPRNH